MHSLGGGSSIESQWPKTKWDLVLFFLIALALTFIFILCNLAYQEYGDRARAALLNEFGIHQIQIMIGALIAVTGVAAHVFKKANQRWYGLVEVVFGVGSGFSIALSVQAQKISLAQWSSLVGCSYVIARGLNNISDARKGRALIENEESA